jgi:protein-disulfide isomerase
MSKRQRDANGREGPPMNRSRGGPGWMGLATLAGVALVLFVGIESWTETRAIKTTIDERLTQLETRLTQLSAKVDTVGRAAPQAQRGPDPNKVYAVKTDGAPFKGPKDAPVVIAEFSDFQ